MRETQRKKVKASRNTAKNTETRNVKMKLGIKEREQGFLTSKGRFLDRKEAAKVALKCGQIKKPNYFKDRLDSSDLCKSV